MCDFRRLHVRFSCTHYGVKAGARLPHSKSTEGLRRNYLYSIVAIHLTSGWAEAQQMNPLPNSTQISSNPIQLHDWPHAPTHRTQQAGAYMITSATYQKIPIFDAADRLTLLSNSLFDLAEAYALQLQAWAIFANHYHLIAECPIPRNLKKFTRHLHSSTAIAINGQDNSPGRKVWFQYWESHLTFQRSYFARLSYVHHNPVRHGLVHTPSSYPWCSAGWFERKANPAFFKTIMTFPNDKLEIPDDFAVTPPL